MQSAVMGTRLRAARLVEEHYLPIWRYLRFLGCSEALADDLAQETFVAVLNRPPELKEPGALPAYLRSISRNLYLNSVRKSQSAPATRQLRDTDAAWEQVSRAEDWESHREAVRECLEGLGAPDRDLLERYYGRRDTRAGAAAAFGMTEEGLKSHLRRLKERLRRCVKGKLSHD